MIIGKFQCSIISLFIAGLIVTLLPLQASAQDAGDLTDQAGVSQFSRGNDVSNYFIETPEASKYALILTGPSVSEETINQFRQWSFSLHDILIRDYGYNSDSVSLLYDKGPAAVSDNSRIDGACDRESIEVELALLKQKVRDGDQITIFLIGHGSGRDEESKFNIVGPDITGTEFAAMLDDFSHQDIVIVNTTSASYGFSASLSSEGRVLISSTRSPAEKFDPIFSRYFIEALEQRNGDRDKNNRVSMLEAFNYAKQSVDQYYEELGRLASEHASLDDNGDASFSLNPTPGEADGRLAEIAYLDILATDDENLSPQARTVKATMQELEREVFILRGRKADYLEADYWTRMEELLVNLARATEQYNDILE